jgi:hypothetical protein
MVICTQLNTIRRTPGQLFEYIKHQRIYKADIFNLVNQFVEHGMEKVIEEFNIIQDTDYRAMQIGLHWKNEETHAELMETFLANYSAPYLHLRALSRTTSKKHTEEAIKQLDQYEILLNEIRISKSAFLIDKLQHMHENTLEKHRRQYKDIQTIINYFSLEVSVKETKIAQLLRKISDTEKLKMDINYLTKVLDGLDALRPLWAKEINYEYLFDKNVMPAHDKQRHLESTSGKNNKRKRNN